MSCSIKCFLSSTQNHFTLVTFSYLIILQKGPSQVLCQVTTPRIRGSLRRKPGRGLAGQDRPTLRMAQEGTCRMRGKVRPDVPQGLGHRGADMCGVLLHHKVCCRP